MTTSLVQVSKLLQGFYLGVAGSNVSYVVKTYFVQCWKSILP